jgi:4-hydroxy-3-polyprenylbenzoate decarboxylase
MELTLAITGASGAIYPHRLLQHLIVDKTIRRINLVASSSGIRVLQEELNLPGLNFRNLPEKMSCAGSDKIFNLNNNDTGARIASGSSPVDAMIVLPCSMGTLGSIAHGISRDLIQRAADVMLKERRRLILVVRDTPLNLIHLENMRLVTLAGALVFPACPAYYPGPRTIEEAVDQFLFRILSHLGLNPPGLFRWDGASSTRPTIQEESNQED